MSIGLGIFSQKVYHPVIYDTGPYGSKAPIPPEDLNRHRILREDEELLAFIIAIGSEM